MPKIQIPDSDIKSFLFFINLGKKERSKLVDLIINEPIRFEYYELAKTISQKLNLDNYLTLLFLKTIHSIFLLKYEFELTTKQIISDIRETLNTTKDLKDKLDELIKELTVLLNNAKNFELTSKALILSQSGQNILNSTKIVTDVRPIFDNEKSPNIRTNIMRHSLEIEYYEGPDRKNVIFQLTENDLENLRNKIIRAKKKSKNILEYFNSGTEKKVIIYK